MSGNMTINGLTVQEFEILKHIPCGGDNPISIRELNKILPVGERRIKRIIQQLVDNKKLVIVANRNPVRGKTGYFIPLTESERQWGLQSFKSQVIKEQKRLDVLENEKIDRTVEMKREMEKTE